MSTVTKSVSSPEPNGVPLLVNGDRMTQAEFHRRYEACPVNEKWELIGGIVYMASPLSWSHGLFHQELNLILGVYKAGTPGVEVGDNATIILGEESEPQPDIAFRILREYGGQSQLQGDYVQGAPELVAEVAFSSRAIDLNQKRADYERAGVLEYLVLAIEEQQLYWFHFASAKTIKPNRQGVSRSMVFPGLWIDNSALLARNSKRLIEVVQLGLATREHAAFVKRLQAAHRRHIPPAG
jgi:Uma2 family endonuclease